jgi:serine/threonine protein kinase
MHALASASALLLIDFGNAIHTNEIVEYTGTFQLQTLPYRAPEVLFGCSFDASIDLWSVGVIMVELYTQELLFKAGTSEQLYSQLVAKLAMTIPQSFRGGHYFHTLVPQMHPTAPIKRYRPRDAFVEHLVAVKKLLPHANELFVSFVAGLLQPEPTMRMDASEALRHPFLSQDGLLVGAYHALSRPLQVEADGLFDANGLFDAAASTAQRPVFTSHKRSRADTPAAMTHGAEGIVNGSSFLWNTLEPEPAFLPGETRSTEFS